MTQKPKIQYVGQFYVHGSEAQQLQRQQERKRAKTRLPKVWKEKVQVIYIDPVALAGIAVAVFMLVVMVLGALRIRTDWGAYEQMKHRVTVLRKQSQTLDYEYRTSYDPEVIRSKAQGMGMIPQEEAEQIIVSVTPPEPKPQTTWLDDVKWFFEGLLEPPSA